MASDGNLTEKGLKSMTQKKSTFKKLTSEESLQEQIEALEDLNIELTHKLDAANQQIKNTEAHLLCYQAKRAVGQPKHTKRRAIHVNTQLLSPAQMDSKKADQLCVPTAIVDSGALK